MSEKDQDVIEVLEKLIGNLTEARNTVRTTKQLPSPTAGNDDLEDETIRALYKACMVMLNEYQRLEKAK